MPSLRDPARFSPRYARCTTTAARQPPDHRAQIPTRIETFSFSNAAVQHISADFGLGPPISRRTDARSPTDLIHAPGHTFSLTCFVQQSMPIQYTDRPSAAAPLASWPARPRPGHFLYVVRARRRLDAFYVCGPGCAARGRSSSRLPTRHTLRPDADIGPARPSSIRRPWDRIRWPTSQCSHASGSGRLISRISVCFGSESFVVGLGISLH